MDPELAAQMARTTGIFQLLIAIPTMIFLGGFFFFSVFDAYANIYEFMCALLPNLRHPIRAHITDAAIEQQHSTPCFPLALYLLFLFNAGIPYRS